jgi:tRNA G10  N-methylase Trm11
MYIAILGRQPALGMSELEHLYGEAKTRWFSDQSACITAESFSVDYLGGTQKAGLISFELPKSDWRAASTKIAGEYAHKWSNFEGKLTLGISAYGFDASVRDVQQTGIILKQRLKKAGVSVRLIPNLEPALNSAASHHNKLGLSHNKIELLVVRARDGRVIIAQSIGAQNITAYARRDQERPKRDAFIGMLPPKLAQIMINLALNSSSLPSPIPPQGRSTGVASDSLWRLAPPEGDIPSEQQTKEARHTNSAALDVSSRSPAVTSKYLQPESEPTPGLDLTPGAKPFTSDSGRRGDQNTNNKPLRILDPFCGTGVILQEAALMGYAVYGTDISEKMIDFSRTNLQWLASSHHVDVDATLHPGDAMDTTWQQPIGAVVCESYLGQPFSAPPSPSKLDQVRRNCNHIISTFLQNIAPQLLAGTPLCIAVPAWQASDGHFTHLPLVSQLDQLGFRRYEFKHIDKNELLYYREDQVVARELLVLIKS